MPSVALFVPCYIDQFYPDVAIAALRVLEKLGVNAHVADGAVCCGQPPANAGFERASAPVLAQFVDTFASYDHIVVLSGSCAMHVRLHAHGAGKNGANVAGRTTEFCTFLHDHIGLNTVATLKTAFASRVGLHIGCHSLRGLGVARASESSATPFNKVRALLETVNGISFANLSRSDECCGFGGSFAVVEPVVSAKMGRDRLRDYEQQGTQTIVSTDMSCVMHLKGLAERAGSTIRMLHVAQILDGITA